MLKAGHEREVVTHEGLVARYHALKRDYERLENDYRTELSFRRALEVQGIKQATRLGETITDLLAAREEATTWREAYWALATAGSEPMPTLRLVAPEGA